MDMHRVEEESCIVDGNGKNEISAGITMVDSRQMFVTVSLEDRVAVESNEAK